MYSTKTREVLGNPSPLPSRFPSTLEISLGLRPREISRVSGNLSGVGDGFPNTSLVLVEHGYNQLPVNQEGAVQSGGGGTSKVLAQSLSVFGHGRRQGHCQGWLSVILLPEISD